MPEPLISKLGLAYFRSFRRAYLEFDGGPVLLTGPNGAGKTSVLEAVSLLSPGRGIRGARADDIARRPESIGWKVSATIQRREGPLSVATALKDGSSRTVHVSEKAARQLELARIARILWLSPPMDRLWIEGAEGRRRFLDRMAMSFFPDHPMAVLGYEKAMKERNKLLRDRGSDASWYGALERQMAVHGSRLTSNRFSTIQKLEAEFSKAGTAFPTADLTLGAATGEAVGGRDPDKLAAALRDSRARDAAIGRTAEGPHRDDLHAVYSRQGVDAKSCSTGEQKALLVSLVLANARALAGETGSWPIILLDEVGAHLDEGRRQDLFRELGKMDSHVWITGTEAGLFDGLEENAQCFEVRRSGGESVVSAR